jgi:predicted nucleic acid-binding Zn ribbon protein
MINPWTGEDTDRGLLLLNTTLQDVLERVTEGKLAAFEVVKNVWDEVVSETWRTRSQPVRLEKGVLTVEVSDGGVASRLRLEQHKIKAALEERLGPGEIAQVRLRVNLSRDWPHDP